MRDKFKDTTVKELEKVDLLGAKPKLMSKSSTAANKAAKVNHKGMKNPTQATKTMTASRKPRSHLMTNKRRKPGSTS